MSWSRYKGGWVVCLACILTVVYTTSYTAASVELIEPEITEKDRSHWAFQPVRDPQLPRVENLDDVRNPIDHYVLSQLEQNGLTLLACFQQHSSC